MGTSPADKAAAFRGLHEAEGIFVMPNAWDAGTARLLAAAGFPAIATTSVGVAATLGLPDYQGALSRDDNLAACARIAAAVDLPVSADTEDGYGARPEDAAETVRLCIAAGLAGASLEDATHDPRDPLYEAELAADKVRAAREAIDASGVPLVLTARAECYLVGHDDPFSESVRRLNLYRAAGADCLYAPGPADPTVIGALVEAVDGPLNVVIGLAGSPLTVRQLEDLGVKRISIGGSLARATLALVRRAADEMARNGTFTFGADQIPDAELARILADFERDSGQG
ncbi:MAG: isocitrate lyase/phosphoenolpyruvate mutase family protein [Alphaproteobacteria bacterium]|nr:isocitrate lyase/phosphoenolpyruvate mutase family protein [Alphaproteobacteria bacterium]